MALLEATWNSMDLGKPEAREIQAGVEPNARWATRWGGENDQRDRRIYARGKFATPSLPCRRRCPLQKSGKSHQERQHSMVGIVSEEAETERAVEELPEGFAE